MCVVVSARTDAVLTQSSPSFVYTTFLLPLFSLGNRRENGSPTTTKRREKGERGREGEKEKEEGEKKKSKKKKHIRLYLIISFDSKGGRETNLPNNVCISELKHYQV